jgi:hypothetical protein
MKMTVLALCMADFRSSGKVCRGSNYQFQFDCNILAIVWTHMRGEELKSLIDFVLGADTLKLDEVLREWSKYIVFTT